MKLDTSIFDFKDYRPYLKALVEESTAKKGRDFGHRYFSKQLKWPATYFNDLVNGRKKLSITKAWEIALRLELNSVERDYLTLLTLKTSPRKDLRAFSEGALAKWKHAHQIHTKEARPALHFNALVPLILRTLKRMPAARRTEKALADAILGSVIGDQFAKEEILFSLQVLRETGYLEQSGSALTLKKVNVEDWGELTRNAGAFPMAELFLKYAGCWQSFLRRRDKENFHLKSWFCLLTMEQAQMIVRKIDELRDMALEFDRRNVQAKATEGMQIFQYNLNLLEVGKGEAT
jgi:uncharacterized protein (TIGR02147 family)